MDAAGPAVLALVHAPAFADFVRRTPATAPRRKNACAVLAELAELAGAVWDAPPARVRVPPPSHDGDGTTRIGYRPLSPPSDGFPHDERRPTRAPLDVARACDALARFSRRSPKSPVAWAEAALAALRDACGEAPGICMRPAPPGPPACSLGGELLVAAAWPGGAACAFDGEWTRFDAAGRGVAAGFPRRLDAPGGLLVYAASRRPDATEQVARYFASRGL